MKIVKLRAMAAAVLTAAAIAVVVVGGSSPAQAYTLVWGEIRPLSGNYSPYGSQCMALDLNYNAYLTDVFQWSCNGHTDQQWEARYVGISGGDGVYQIVNKLSGRCMGIRNDDLDLWGNGSQVVQFDCLAGTVATITAQELWKITYDVNDGHYHQIRPMAALVRGWNMCLDVPGGLQNNGIHLEAWSCNGGINQKFFGDPLYGLL